MSTITTHPTASGIAMSRSAHTSRPIRERRQGAWLAAVLDIALQIGDIHDLDLLPQTIVAHTQAAFGYDHVGLLLLEHGALQYRAVAGALRMPPATSQPLAGDSLPAQALRSAAPMFVMGAPVAISALMQARAAAAIPLIVEGQVIGTIDIQRRAKKEWSAAEREALIALGALTASAIQNARRFAAAQQHARDLALLDQVRASAAAQTSLGELLRDVVEQTAHTLGYELVSLYLLRGDRLLLQHQLGHAALPASLSWEDGLLGQVVRTGQPLLQRDPADGERGATTSGVCVPLRAGGVVCGVLHVESAGARLLDEHDQRLLMGLAEQVDMAIEFSQLYEALEARVAQLALVDDISRTVTASLDQHAALQAIVTHVPRAVPCQRLSLASYDPTDHTFTIRALWLERGMSTVDVGTVASIGDTEAGVALRTGRPHYVYNLAESLYTFSKLLAAEGLRSMVHVPIMAPEGCLGMLTLSRNTPRAFSAYDLALLGSLAPHIATAFRNAELYTRAQQAYAELAAAQERNVQAEKLRALGELASGVAHDFNNLLAIILGHMDMLKTPESPNFTRSRRAIIQAAQDGARTVRRIQEFVRAKPELHTTGVDLAELAEDVLHLTRPRWRDKMQRGGATVVVRQELRAVAPILGDAAELREVVTNLILNAVDAMPSGGALTLATGTDGTEVWLEVRDTGTGIPADVRERIFEPFYTTKAQRGTGLGLAVSRSIARRHGGDLTVESEQGVGSRFRLALPLPEVAPPLPIPTPAAPRAELAALRILLIEDERAVRDTMAQLLGLDGHTVDSAAGGVAALDMFAPGVYDVICSDLGMPDMSGWDVLTRLRQRDPGPITVLLTGWGGQLDPDEARGRGVDFVVPKPLDLDALYAALAAARPKK